MAGTGSAEDAASALARVARDGRGRLLALLAARTRDLPAAEDALAEALAAAADHWPRGGVPRNPEAWLLTVARRRQMDAARHARVVRDAPPPDAEAGDDNELPDRRLELMFVCAHPAIDPAVRAPLMLQAVLGLDGAAIAALFLMQPAAMAQRLVRAKAKIKLAGIPFAVPPRAEMPARLGHVLDAIYAAFTAAWPDGADPDGLAGEAVWLASLVARLAPGEPEALGLLSLLLHHAARRDARRTTEGAYVPLDAQDPALWDGPLISEANALLWRAAEHRRPGRFQIEAAIQSAHAHRRERGETDWASVDALYGQLRVATGSPVVAVNHALVAARLHGAEAGLVMLEAAGPAALFARYQPWWAARAHLLAQAGRTAESSAAFDRAAILAPDPAAADFLRAAAGRMQLGTTRGSSVTSAT